MGEFQQFRGSKTIDELYLKIPKYNSQYDENTGEDNRPQILREAIGEQFTSDQASLFIKCINRAIPHSQKKLVELFNQLKF